MTNYEKETTITYNADEDCAYVYSAYEPDIRRLDKLVEERKEAKCTHKDGAGKFYKIPKSWVKIKPERTKKILSEEEKQKKREMFFKNVLRKPMKLPEAKN